jgi:F0F1-type ATP synthase gamma subunit
MGCAVRVATQRRLPAARLRTEKIMRVTSREFARQLAPDDAREMLEELLDSMPRETILGVLVEKLNAEEIARLTNMRMQ